MQEDNELGLGLMIKYKKILFFSFLAIINYSCNDDDKIDFNYYPDGTVKEKRFYRNNKVDSIIIFYKNGLVKESGDLVDNQKKGWWSYFDNKGVLNKKIDYYHSGDSIFQNQSLYYKNGSIDEVQSSYFNIDIKDTLHTGKNSGFINYNSNFKEQNKNVQVLIYNQEVENKIKIDTFMNDINNINNIKFGVFFNSSGNNIVHGEIIEQLLIIKEINQDSSKLIVKEHRKFFDKEVFVEEKK